MDDRTRREMGRVCSLKKRCSVLPKTAVAPTVGEANVTETTFLSQRDERSQTSHLGCSWQSPHLAEDVASHLTGPGTDGEGVAHSTTGSADGDATWASFPPAPRLLPGLTTSPGCRMLLSPDTNGHPRWTEAGRPQLPVAVLHGCSAVDPALTPVATTPRWHELLRPHASGQAGWTGVVGTRTSPRPWLPRPGA